MSSSGGRARPRRAAGRRPGTARGSRDGPPGRSAPPARSRRGPTARDRARGGRSGAAPPARRRSARAGPSRGPATGRYSSSRRISIGVGVGRRQRAHSPASAVVSRAVARMPRFSRDRRMWPAIGCARTRSSGSSMRTSAMSYSRSAPTASPSNPATLKTNGPSSGLTLIGVGSRPDGRAGGLVLGTPVLVFLVLRGSAGP